MYHDCRYQALETAVKVIGKPYCLFMSLEITNSMPYCPIHAIRNMNSMPYCPTFVSRSMNSTPETLAGFLCTDTLPESKNQRGLEYTEE